MFVDQRGRTFHYTGPYRTVLEIQFYTKPDQRLFMIENYEAIYVDVYGGCMVVAKNRNGDYEVLAARDGELAPINMRYRFVEFIEARNAALFLAKELDEATKRFAYGLSGKYDKEAFDKLLAEKEQTEDRNKDRVEKYEESAQTYRDARLASFFQHAYDDLGEQLPVIATLHQQLSDEHRIQGMTALSDLYAAVQLVMGRIRGEQFRNQERTDK